MMWFGPELSHRYMPHISFHRLNKPGYPTNRQGMRRPPVTQEHRVEGVQNACMR